MSDNAEKTVKKINRKGTFQQFSYWRIDGSLYGSSFKAFVSCLNSSSRSTNSENKSKLEFAPVTYKIDRDFEIKILPDYVFILNASRSELNSA